MAAEFLDRSLIAGTSQAHVDKFIISDQKIRSGLCPNDCGLMRPCEYGQECPKCHFSTNVLPEPETPN